MFTKDEVVWVKSAAARQIFWPAKVIDHDRLLTWRKKKPTIACVQFLVENTVEAITDTEKLLPFNCEQKKVFINKGRGLKDSLKRLQFDSAVKLAEKEITIFEKLKDSPKIEVSERKNRHRKSHLAGQPRNVPMRKCGVNLRRKESVRSEYEEPQDCPANIDKEQNLSRTVRGTKRTRLNAFNEEAKCPQENKRALRKHPKSELGGNSKPSGKNSTLASKGRQNLLKESIKTVVGNQSQKSELAAGNEVDGEKKCSGIIHIKSDSNLVTKRSRGKRRSVGETEAVECPNEVETCINTEGCKESEKPQSTDKRVLHEPNGIKTNPCKKLLTKFNETLYNSYTGSLKDVLENDKSINNNPVILNDLNGSCSTTSCKKSEDGPGVELKSINGERELEDKNEINEENPNLRNSDGVTQNIMGEDKSREGQLPTCNEQTNGLESEQAEQQTNIDTCSSDDEDESSLPEAFSPSPGLERLGFQKGDVVWAKYPHTRLSCWWPAQIGRVTKIVKKIYYYVSFLPKKEGSRCVKVQKKNVISFTCDADTHERYKNQDVPSIEKCDFDEALKEAEDILVRRVSHKEIPHESFPEDEDASISSLPSNEDTSLLTTVDDPREDNDDDGFGSNETEEDENAKISQPQAAKRKRRTNSKYNEIMVEFHRCKKTLLDIFHEKISSVRHKKFHYGNVSEKDSLKHMSGFGPIQDEDIHEEIIETLTTWYKEVKESFIHLDYIFDVWIPEAIIFFIQSKENINRADAESMFLDHKNNVTKENIADADSWLKNHKISESEKQECLDRARRAFQLK